MLLLLPNGKQSKHCPSGFSWGVQSPRRAGAEETIVNEERQWWFERKCPPRGPALLGGVDLLK